MTNKNYIHIGEDNARHVLLLNASYEVIRVVNWQRAVNLFFTHKAIAPSGYEHQYVIPALHGDYHLPSALVLETYVNIPYFKIRATRRNVFRRDGLTCQYTGEKLTFKEATIDHILPQSRGGSNTWGNMVTCERRLNQRKGDRTPKEAGLQLIREPVKPSRAELVLGAYLDVEPWKRFLPNKKK